MFCHNCGAGLAPTARFCTRCGSQVWKDEPASAPTPASGVGTGYGRQQRGSPIFTKQVARLGLAVGVALMLFAVGATMYAKRNKPIIGVPDVAASTAGPADVAAVQPTAQPTDIPSPTRTPRPTATPVPTETPEPTNTPAPTATPEPTATPQPDGMVAAQVLNVREGPGTSYPILKDQDGTTPLQLTSNTPFHILGYVESLGWLKVKLADDREGWISGGNFVKLNVPLDTVPATYFRPLTGMIQKETIPKGIGEIHIENQGSQDELIVVARGKEPVASAYVRGGEKHIIYGINDGSYSIFGSSGEDWDGQGFTRNVDFWRFEEDSSFVTTQTTLPILEITVGEDLGQDEGVEIPSDEFPLVTPDKELETPSDMATGNGASPVDLAAEAGLKTLSTSDFSNGSDDWFVVDEKEEALSVVDGYYEMHVKVPDSLSWSWMDGAQDLEDGAIAADLRVVGTGEAGLMLRNSLSEDKGHVYVCTITNASEFRCARYADGEWTTLAGPNVSRAIKPNDVNRLVMLAVGERFRFAINGQQVATFEDEVVEAGLPGVYGATYDEQDKFHFDNVVTSGR